MTAIALVQKVKDLPPVSQAALKLISLLDKPTVDNDAIVQVLTYDNVLTAKLLRACNSPAFGLEESVESVDQAVVLLGHKQILHTVMALAFGSVMTVSSATYTMEMNELWEHSLVSAVAAEVVREQLPELGARANVAFTASLLHDIGKLILAMTLTKDQISEICDCIERKQISGSQAEKEILGLDHSDVGAALLRSWRLPENIVEAVANHHRPVLKPEPRLSALVHIANGLAHFAKPPLGQKSQDLRIDAAVVAAFGIEGNKLGKMTEAAGKSFEQVDQFMEMG